MIITNITKLLASREYRGNQTLLAKELKLNRGTFIKYMKDANGDHHIVLEKEGKYSFYANMTNKLCNLEKASKS